MKAILLLALSGCVLQPLDFQQSGPDEDHMTAREYYDHNVAPVITLQCSSCHTQGALDLSYDSIISMTYVNGTFQPTQSRVVLKGAHEGPYLDTATTDTIEHWLQLEATERGY